MAEIENVKKVMDEAMTEIQEEAMREGYILEPQYAEITKRAKEMILEKAGISLEDYDNFVRNNPEEKTGVREIAETLERTKETERQKIRRDEEFNSLLEKFKSQHSDLIEGLPNKELKDGIESVQKELERLWGFNPSKEKTKYTKQLLDKYAEELEESLEERREAEEDKKEVEIEFEKIKKSIGWKNLLGKLKKK